MVESSDDMNENLADNSAPEVKAKEQEPPAQCEPTELEPEASKKPRFPIPPVLKEASSQKNPNARLALRPSTAFLHRSPVRPKNLPVAPATSSIQGSCEITKKARPVTTNDVSISRTTVSTASKQQARSRRSQRLYSPRIETPYENKASRLRRKSIQGRAVSEVVNKKGGPGPAMENSNESKKASQSGINTKEAKKVDVSVQTEG